MIGENRIEIFFSCSRPSIGGRGNSGQKSENSTYYPKYEIFTKNKLIKI